MAHIIWKKKKNLVIKFISLSDFLNVCVWAWTCETAKKYGASSDHEKKVYKLNVI